MKKAIIYCRVSTDEEAQANALVSQIKEAEQAVKQNNWVLMDRYIDEGKSGTTTRKRDEYNRLVIDMGTNKFDIIVVKSQDRLMRNTKEWYVFVDKLVQSGKQLYFYLEQKFYTPDDALITGIKAILAEEYSRDLSKKINNAHKHRQQSGSRIVITSKTWGYKKVGKDVVIDENEAEIIKLIYELCIQGYGSRTISKELQERGIKSRTGNKFQETTIRRIIRNPLYMGTVVMNQLHYDFNKKKVEHVPQSEWYIHENAVDPIVSSEIWEKANKIMDKRSVEINASEWGKQRKGVNLGNHDLSGKVICGECGQKYWRRYHKNSKGEIVVYWSCSEYVRRGRKTNNTNRGKNKEKLKINDGCDNIHIKENILMDALYDIAKIIFSEDKEDIIKSAMMILNDVLSDNDDGELKELQAKKKNISVRRESLLDKVLDGVIDNDLYKIKDSQLKSEYEEVQAKITIIEERNKNKERKKERLEEIRNEVVDIADKGLSVQRILDYVEQITVYPTYADVSLEYFGHIQIDIERKSYKKMVMTVHGADI